VGQWLYESYIVKSFFKEAIEALAAPTKLQKYSFKFIIILNASMSIREVMICSMFISEVSEMRTSVVRAVLTSLGVGDETQ
jgi:hypothetical protein